MSRYKKPDAPKFVPVFIAGYRQAVHSLATPEDERKKMIEEDGSRIALEKTVATLDRLQALQNSLGLSGKFDENLLPLLIAVANKYVPGFEVHVGAQPKPGVKKVGDRFKTVTEIEGVKILRNLPSIKEAIEVVATERRPTISAQDLNTKYYTSRREIEACEPAAELLRYWLATCSNRPDLAQDAFFDNLFWTVEREHMNATVPHNVTPLKVRKHRAGN
jgi:hypothetical protein